MQGALSQPLLLWSQPFYLQLCCCALLREPPLEEARLPRLVTRPPSLLAVSVSASTGLTFVDDIATLRTCQPNAPSEETRDGLCTAFMPSLSCAFCLLIYLACVCAFLSFSSYCSYHIFQVTSHISGTDTIVERAFFQAARSIPTATSTSS